MIYGVGILSLCACLAGCGKSAPSGGGEATPSEVKIVQELPETIAPLGLEGQILPGLNDVDLPEAAPAPEYLRIGVRH